MPKCKPLVPFNAPLSMKKICMDLADSEGTEPIGDP